MPNTYAHWRFGDMCIKTLPTYLQNVVNDNRAIFDYGVHGPDCFFFYKALKKNDVNKYGTLLHNTPFSKTLNSWYEGFKNSDDKKAALAYLLGYTCHFALDNMCHGYVNKRAEVSKDTLHPTTHSTIETQFDKHLLYVDGYNPFKMKIYNTLKPSRKMAHVIGQMITDLDEETIYQSLVDHKKYLIILKDSNRLKRDVLITFMDLAGASNFKDLLLTKNNHPEIEDAILRLDKLFDKALGIYPKLVDSLIKYLESNKRLIKEFDGLFDPKDFDKIKVLPLEEKKQYAV